ncbi:MAG: glycosyltransferase family 2 protein [Nanoarchaeota archaeon]
MNWIDFAFFFYMFVGIYMLSLLIITNYSKKEQLFYYPKGKPEPVSVVMPCFNDSEHLGEAIEALLALDYPKEMLEIIIVDDKSSDNSVEIAKQYARKYKNIRFIQRKTNSGGAAQPTNDGILNAKYNYIAVVDSDSTPRKDALIKMIGFLQNDQKVGGVTCAVLSKPPVTFFQKIQAIEYAIIAWNRKLLDTLDAVYVTPGPFALYRKKTLMEIGLFDTKNLTQDIEIVWRLRSCGYVAKMCLDTRVESATPTSFKAWFKQRIRWNIGGTQTLLKYKSYIMKNGTLGYFIIPFFCMNLFLGLIGLGLYTYLLSRKIFLYYLTTYYSYIGDTSLFVLKDLSFSPSILNFLGAALFIAGLLFTLEGLGVMKQERFGKGNLFNIMFYIIVYLAVYPFIMLTGLIKLMTGRYKW